MDYPKALKRSGAGHTAFLAADLVGESDEVIGADRVRAAVVAATKAAVARGLRNVTFREGDPTEMAFDRPFDAVVGRYVLLFQADPAVMVRKLAGHLRPGGAIVFHEPEWDSTDRFRRRRPTTAAAGGSPRRSACPEPPIRA
jgi:SAM-dependent methyltransferase